MNLSSSFDLDEAIRRIVPPASPFDELVRKIAEPPGHALDHAIRSIVPELPPIERLLRGPAQDFARMRARTEGTR